MGEEKFREIEILAIPHDPGSGLLRFERWPRRLRVDRPHDHPM